MLMTARPCQRSSCCSCSCLLLLLTLLLSLLPLLHLLPPAAAAAAASEPICLRTCANSPIRLRRWGGGPMAGGHRGGGPRWADRPAGERGQAQRQGRGGRGEGSGAGSGRGGRQGLALSGASPWSLLLRGPPALLHPCHSIPRVSHKHTPPPHLPPFVLAWFGLVWAGIYTLPACCPQSGGQRLSLRRLGEQLHRLVSHPHGGQVAAVVAIRSGRLYRYLPPGVANQPYLRRRVRGWRAVWWDGGERAGICGRVVICPTGS